MLDFFIEYVAPIIAIIFAIFISILMFLVIDELTHNDDYEKPNNVCECSQ